MTRLALLGCFVLALGGAAADDKKGVPKELAPFQGTWKVIEASRGGTPAPKTPDLVLTFENDKVAATENGKAGEGGTFAVDPKKEPTAIDLITTKGDKVLGICKFDKDGKLTVCFGQEKGAARPKGFDDKEAAVLVLEKVKK